MHKLPKALTFMGALLALTFCAVACKTDDDDEPTMYTVTVSDSLEHGKVSVDKTSAEAGATIKLTATADSGYELESYSVKDASANELTVTEGTFTMPKSNVTVTATFAAVTYTVTFNSNGGSDVESQTVASGSKATEPAEPTKTTTTTTKYTFDGWYSDSGLTTPFSFDTAITENITLYAKWTETAITPQKTAGSISYATTSVEKTTADEDFTNELTKTGDGTVSYASSKTDVAEVNTQTGLVTIKGAGETTITATVADSDTYTYATKTASYTLTVTAADTTPQKTAGSISYATTTVSKTTADAAFTNTLTKTGDGTVTYASSKTDVATVNATTGEVTIAGAGETTITATVADSDTYTYATKTASYTLTVTQATPSYTVSIASGIEHGTVAADKTSAEKGATVTLTLSASNGYEFSTLSVTDASNAEITTTAVTEGSKYTFTMPESNVTVSATFTEMRTKASGKIGKYEKPYKVGDIVFSDGSATAYTSDLTLTNEQKSKAVAVIFYVGTECSNDSASRTLGVGLKNTGTDNTLAWAISSAAGCGTKITAIQCTPSESGSGTAATATFTDDLDGSDNWEALCEAVSDEGTSGNYPAWEWVNAYATTASLTGDYASGWYLPTVAELSMLYRVKATVNAALEAAGGTEIADTGYWSSSQFSSGMRYAWPVQFDDGSLSSYYGKSTKQSVCGVRAF